jgi:hypothetical protein
MGGLIVANAVAPWNHPYLLDILHAAAAGAVRNSLTFHLNNFFANAEGYAPYAAGFVVSVWMWARGLAPLRVPLAIAGILAIGALVLSQNHQSHGLPVRCSRSAPPLSAWRAITRRPAASSFCRWSIARNSRTLPYPPSGGACSLPSPTAA